MISRRNLNILALNALAFFFLAIPAHAGEVVTASPSWEAFTSREGQGLYHDLLRAIYEPRGETLRHLEVPAKRGLVMVREGGPPTTVFAWRSGCKVMGGPPSRTMTIGGSEIGESAIKMRERESASEPLPHALRAFPHFCLYRLAGFLVFCQFRVPERCSEVGDENIGGAWLAAVGQVDLPELPVEAEE